MITPKIKALFQFIEYLHSNIENFNRNNDLIKELELLDEERQQVCCKRNFTEKLRYDELQSEIEKKFKVLQDNTATLIKGKAKELNICNFNNEPDYSFNGIEYEIRQLKENFSKKDLPEIAKSKQQYIEYRQNTHKTFLSLGFFIDELDLITQSLFYYFKDTEQNEYEAFEKKTFGAGSIKEAIQKYFNEAHKDQRFQLTSFVEETEQAKPTYKSFKREIEKNGWVILKTETDAVNIYTPELAVIFTSKELPALNMDTKQEATINGCKYLKTYIEAYKEGEQYFETEFKVSPNTLYGANAEQYVRDIHFNFFHVQHTVVNEGWGYVKRNYPIVLTHKAVKEFGYYSGIVNKVEEQVKKYPILFANFDKCEHRLPPEPINSEAATKKYIAKHYALAYLLDCHSKGKIPPLGKKAELERIGNEYFGTGRGNTFYKALNCISKYDLNKESDLIEIGGDNWRKAVIDLSNNPEKVEQYLLSKNL